MASEAELKHQAELSARQEELTKFAKWHRCGQCESLLVVRWWRGMWEVKCGRDKEHTGYISWRETPAQIEREAKQMAVDKLGTEKGVALEPYTGRAALTKVEAEVVLRTIWPKAPQAEIVKAALICQDYGLNPLMKHLFLVPFNEGKPNESWAVILSIHANRLLARRRGAYSYVDDTPRVMTEAEQIRRFGQVDKHLYWAITKVKDAQGNEMPGYGNWPNDKGVYGADKGNTPQKMAFIRSERDALDRLFPGELPALEVAEARYVEAPVIVNGKTGEIQESPPSPAKVEVKVPAPAPMQDGTQPPPASQAKQPQAPVPNGAGSKLTPAQHRAIETLALKKGYAFPQGLEAELAQHEDYPAKVDDLTVAQASTVIDWLSGKGKL